MADHECEECGARYGTALAADRCALTDCDADRAALLNIRRRERA
ncbi:hypothetical protein [Brachybacterium halotolerans]|nr:hypothetical protein [Brachybacterium halotolerans]